MQFNSIEELYIRVTPALTTKVNEINKNNIDIKAIDIFDYLKDNVWVKSHDLTLSDIVSDILNVNESDIIIYLNNK